MNSLEYIAHQIRSKRLARKLTQKELALAAGVALRSYLRLERGEPGVRIETLTRVLDSLGLNFATVSKRRPVLEELGDRYGDVP